MALGGATGAKGLENTLQIEDLARFAVAQHNTTQNSALVFEKAVDVKTQVVSGTIYDIKLVAKDGGHEKVYEAKVWVKPWENFKQLQDFKLVGDYVPVEQASKKPEDDTSNV